MTETPPPNSPAHPPPIPQQRPPKRERNHRHHVKARAAFLPKEHVLAKHGLKPIQD